MRKAAAGAESLKGARLAEAGRSERGQPDMAALPGEVAAPRIKPFIQNQAGAESGAESQKRHGFHSLPGTEFPLGDRSGIGVVLKPDRAAEAVFEHADDRHLIPAGQIRRRLNHSGAAVQRTAAGDAEAVEPIIGQLVPGQHPVGEAGHLLDAPLRLTELRSGENAALQKLQFAVRPRGAEDHRTLGAADIESDQKFFIHQTPSRNGS